MKALIIPALILGSPYWLSADEPCPTTLKLQTVAGPGEVQEQSFTLAVFAGEPKTQDGRSEKAEKSGKAEKRIVIRQSGKGESDEERATKGWLGVSIGKVPDSLAVQLGTEGRGLLVQNVVEDSPADRAGFQAHDVILAIDGDDIEADVTGLVNVIGDRKPGEALRFVVLREGEEVTLNATLGSRADQQAMQFDWKFQTPPDAEVEDEVHTRGRFMFRTPDGEWIMRDLGDLNDIELPDDVKMMLPESGSRTVQVFVDNDGSKVRTKVERDGSSTAVEQADDGITVTRTDEDGNETTNTYASEEELKAQDEEAYKILKGTGGAFQFKIDGLDEDALNFNFDTDLHGGLLGDPQWEQRMQQSLQHAQQAYEQAMEQFHQLHQGTPGDPHFFAVPGGSGKGPNVIGLRSLSKPKHTFEVRPDGTIEVRIRKGDSELVQLFRNEGDLERRDPDLAAKYQDLMEAGR